MSPQNCIFAEKLEHMQDESWHWQEPEYFYVQDNVEINGLIYSSVGNMRILLEEHYATVHVRRTQSDGGRDMFSFIHYPELNSGGILRKKKFKFYIKHQKGAFFFTRVNQKQLILCIVEASARDVNCIT